MMNGRPAWAMRALMGAAELYITLLSVCERLLKALKSPGTDTGAATSHQTSPKTAADDNVSQSKLTCPNKGKRSRKFRHVPSGGEEPGAA